jgi:hypothetical protein
MTIALRQQDTGTGAGLTVFAFFHLNLAFSSIEEERRDDVIARCYWPLLTLAEAVGPLGLEISGYTLEEVAARDPAWIAAARAAIAAGRIELIGSGYSQMIGPLAPARVIAENLRIGMESYERLLGVRPRIALVNEQAYSAGLVGQYLDAGFEALIMDFDNPSAAHPEWDSETAYLPHHAAGADGRRIALLWSNTIAFQQMQRLAHGDIELDTYAAFVRGRHGNGPRALCLYASDAEIFDFRPGRFKTEERLTGREWPRIEQALRRVTEDGAVLTRPSGVLALLQAPGCQGRAGRTLRLESPAMPVPVKKQRKYNLARWAVTGRDNTAINAACQRIHDGMIASPAPDWKELCYLWASDFRTHLTEKRWNAFRERLKAAEAKWSAPRAAFPAPPATPPREDRHLDIITPSLSVTLDRRRGLALSNLHFAPQAAPAIGGLPHGFFDDIALQADWYTGDCVFEAPGEHKITDLDWCEARIEKQDNGDVIAHALLDTARGRIEKRMRFCADQPRVDFDLQFHWPELGKGVLRLGHFTLLPQAFDLKALALTTCNGGAPERFALADQTIEHGAPVSFLVSSSHGLGLSEGWLDIGDDRTRLRIEVDRATAPLLGLVTHRAARRTGGGDSLFCQIQLSALELDDTRKPGAYEDGPRRFRFSIRAV